MKSRGWIVVGVLLFTVSILAIGLERADAGSCGVTSSCNLELTASNVTQLTPIDVRVTWDNTGATTVLSVQYASGGPGTPKFINEFAYNSAVLTTKVTYHGADVTTLWIGTGPPSPQINQNVDGFGKFALDYGMSLSGGDEGIAFPIVFTLASKITSIPDNDHLAEFVVHIAWGTPSCSGFVSDGATTSPGSNPNCGGVAPEPGTLALFGSGLVSVGALLRRRLFNRGRKEEVV